MRVLFCGGGTAGHITPALAIAEEIKKVEPNSSFLFIGREDGNENKIIIKEGYTLKTIKIQGLRRSISGENIKSAILTLKAIKKAKEIIRDFKPDIVLGTGGYVCLPVILAARQMKIKSALHESNVIPGLTTKLLSKRVNLLLLGQEETGKSLKGAKQVRIVGTPIRSDFHKTNRENARRQMGLRESDFFILSFGGSLGSEKMNETIARVMERYSSKEDDIVHVHGCGERYYEQLKKSYHFTDETRCKIIPFIRNVPSMMIAADMVISRCGAVTLAEISYAGIPSILIPSPNVSDNHQLRNAMYFSSKGAANLIEEEKLTAENLETTIKRLKNDKNGRKNVAKCLKALSKPNSAKCIVNELKSLILEQ